MGTSVYDENILTDEQRRQVEAFKAEWQRASAAGDRAGMDAAHRAAESVRAQAGYSGEADGGGYTQLPKDRQTQYTGSRLASYQPQTDRVNQVYDAAREAQLAQLKSAFEANNATLEAQRAEIPLAFQAQRNQTAAQSELAGKNFREYAAASGLNSGTGGQAELARSNQLQGDLSALGRQEEAAQRDLAEQITELKITYQNAVAEAIAKGEYERAAALLEEYRRAEESKVTASQAQADENYRTWSAGYQMSRDSVEDQYTQWQKALQEAELWAGYGDYSKLRELGVDTSSYEAKLAAANAPRTGTGSEETIPPLGTNDWFDYIIGASEEAGQAPEDFLRSHKSDLGITESNIKTYVERLEAYREAANAPRTGTRSAYEQALDIIHNSNVSTIHKLRYIQDALATGVITDAEAGALMDEMGR